MKVLDVESLVGGMEATVKGIDRRQENITQLSKHVNDVISLDEAFDGKGRKRLNLSIRIVMFLFYSITASF